MLIYTNWESGHIFIYVNMYHIYVCVCVYICIHKKTQNKPYVNHMIVCAYANKACSGY